MTEPLATPDPGTREAYRVGVLALLEGRLDDATRELEHAVTGAIPEAALALAKVHLERGNGAETRRLLAGLLDPPPADAGLHAYLMLLDACGAALDGRSDEAVRLIDASRRLDSRLEQVARLLRRRVEKGRPPVLRF